MAGSPRSRFWLTRREERALDDYLKEDARGETVGLTRWPARVAQKDGGNTEGPKRKHAFHGRKTPEGAPLS